VKTEAMLYNVLLALHLISATVWIGGHLVLVLGFLPLAIQKKDSSIVSSFEEVYEKIGIPALIIQVISGFWLGYLKLPDFSLWFVWSNYSSKLLSIKVIALGLTIILALHARLRIIPKLQTANLIYLAFHIAGVTILALVFLLAGLSFRTGWF
jgi:putative copper export protein